MARGADKSGNILGEFVQNHELASQTVDRDVVLRLKRLQKIEDVPANIDQVGAGSVERIKKDDRHTAWVFAFQIIAVGKNIVGQWMSGLGKAGVSAENTAIFCGLPSSKTVKSSLLRPAMGWPLLS